MMGTKGVMKEKVHAAFEYAESFLEESDRRLALEEFTEEKTEEKEEKKGWFK